MTDNTQQGLQNQMFGALIFLFVIISLILQVIPMFVIQRELYEARYIISIKRETRPSIADFNRNIGSANVVLTTGLHSCFLMCLPNSSGTLELPLSVSWCGSVQWAYFVMHGGLVLYTPGACLSSWSSGRHSSSEALLPMRSSPVHLQQKPPPR
jgi:ABC-type multidrug transport system permease subunit